MKCHSASIEKNKHIRDFVLYNGKTNVNQFMWLIHRYSSGLPHPHRSPRTVVNEVPPKLYYKSHLSRQYNCWSLKCSLNIDCRCCSNNVILDLTPVASGIGFDDTIISAAGAIRKHKEHPNVEKIRREFDEIKGEFDFRPVTVDLVMQNIKNINPKKATGYDNIPGKTTMVWKLIHLNSNSWLCHQRI